MLSPLHTLKHRRSPPPRCADKPSVWNPGALIPVPEIHGNAREVTADNVAKDKVDFKPSDLAQMEAVCGPQQVPEHVRPALPRALLDTRAYAVRVRAGVGSAEDGTPTPRDARRHHATRTLRMWVFMTCVVCFLYDETSRRALQEGSRTPAA